MKKREFLAMGGAVPLMLAGCGGNGNGSAPMRLVNASVGYPALGFMIESTQITSSDVAYGDISQYYNVEAGAVDITLTVNKSSATTAQTRTLQKDQRYSLIAFGYTNELKFIPLAESTVTPDTGKANVNVLNTSTDIGAVDVYVSSTPDLSTSTLIAASVGGGIQSAFSGVLAGSYYITVVGANSIAQGISDVRFQTPTAITLTALQILTIILTPGVSGVLANAILLTQGTSGTAVDYLNATARVRAVTAIPGTSISVTGVSPVTGSTPLPVTLLSASTIPQYSNYFVVSTGTAPTVTVGGTQYTVYQDTTTTNATTQVTTTTTAVASLEAGGDYTLMVYIDPTSGNPTAKVITDNNTAPVTSSGVKFRLINLASNNRGLELSMSVNKQSIAANIPYPTASAYTEISVPQAFTSTIDVDNGPETLVSYSSVLTLPNIFTEIVVGVDPNNGKVLDFFRSSSGT